VPVGTSAVVTKTANSIAVHRSIVLAGLCSVF
jgi:hypothetical protein